MKRAFGIYIDYILLQITRVLQITVERTASYSNNSVATVFITVIF
jgi:hypothetical protein